MSSKEQKRTYPEDGEEECALTRTEAKKSRTCEKFPPFSLLLKLWVLKNYEYSPGSGYISFSSIISHVQSDKEMLQQNEGKPLAKTQIHVKPTIHKLWGRKVTTTHHRFEKNGKKVRAFKNLRKKGDSSAAGFDSEGSAGEHVIMVPGWQVVINNDKSLSILRVEDWLLDGQRVVTEIRAGTLYNCSISAHGCKLDISDLGFKVGQLSSPKEELELLAKCISGTQLCKGFSLPDSGFSTHSTFKVAEYSNASDTTVSETRIFSSSCRIVCCRRLFCPECLNCKKILFQKKKRERRRLGKINKYTNHRFMTREQLEFKMKEMQKELINYKMKVKQLENRDEEEEVGDDDDDDGDDDDGDGDGDGDGDDDDDDDADADDDDANDDGGDDDDDDDDDDGGGGGDDDGGDNDDGDGNNDDDSDSADDDSNNTQIDNHKCN